MRKSAKTQSEGAGRLLVATIEHEVRYNYSLAYAQDGRQTAKGAIEGAADLMRDAFRQGRCGLILENGLKWPVQVVAHSQGSDMAYFIIEDLPKSLRPAG